MPPLRGTRRAGTSLISRRSTAARQQARATRSTQSSSGSAARRASKRELPVALARDAGRPARRATWPGGSLWMPAKIVRGAGTYSKVEVVRRAASRSISRRHAPVLEQRLELGGEHEPARRVDVVQRLLAEAIARQQQTPAPRVPEREREHAVEALDAIAARAPRRGGRSPRCRVWCGSDGPSRSSGAAQLAEVVDLAVEDDPDASRPRCTSAGCRSARSMIAEAAEAEADAVRRCDGPSSSGPRCRRTLVIRRQHVALDGAARIDDAADAAHGGASRR